MSSGHLRCTLHLSHQGFLPRCIYCFFSLFCPLYPCIFDTRLCSPCLAHSLHNKCIFFSLLALFSLLSEWTCNTLNNSSTWHSLSPVHLMAFRVSLLTRSVTALEVWSTTTGVLSAFLLFFSSLLSFISPLHPSPQRLRETVWSLICSSLLLSSSLPSVSVVSYRLLC